jgi:cytidylate kinase
LSGLRVSYQHSAVSFQLGKRVVEQFCGRLRDEGFLYSFEVFTMIRIITIEREYGSGGGVIAEKVASRLGWKLWDQALTDVIALRLDCDRRTVEEREERKDPASYRLMKAFMHGSYEGSLNAPRLKMVDADCIREVTQQILMEVAETGNGVIVGRGSAYYLGSRRDAFHVFIYAPFEAKVRRLRALGKSEKEATELAETVDVGRAAFIKKYFKVDWPERHRFHLMVNSCIGDEVTVGTILETHARFEKQRT